MRQMKSERYVVHDLGRLDWCRPLLVHLRVNVKNAHKVVHGGVGCVPDCNSIYRSAHCICVEGAKSLSTFPEGLARSVSLNCLGACSPQACFMSSTQICMMTYRPMQAVLHIRQSLQY